MNRGEARRHSQLPAVAAVTILFPFLMQMAKKKIYPGDEFMQWGGSVYKFFKKRGGYKEDRRLAKPLNFAFQTPDGSCVFSPPPP